MATNNAINAPFPFTLTQGGTGASLTASNGGIIYSNASTMAVLAGTATAGQLLVSGSSAAPAWSTATFPTVGGAAGNILISNGTNYVASTSLWPNTVGSAGKIIRSDGTTNAYTTSTYPDTNAVSTLLYASSANVMAALATANNGTLVTSSGGVPSILAGPGTTGNVLQSNAAAAPSFSTATFASTYAVSTILYASASNVVTGLATTNRAAFSTNSTGVPTWLALTDGQIVVGSTAGSPAAAALTAGTGVSITNASNSITINTVGGGLTWVDQTTTPVTAAVNTGYVANNAGLVTINLPAVYAVGDSIAIVGNGAGLWLVAPAAGDTIKLGSSSAATSIAATLQYDCMQLVCTVASTTWVARNCIGNLTIV